MVKSCHSKSVEVNNETNKMAAFNRKAITEQQIADLSRGDLVSGIVKALKLYGAFVVCRNGQRMSGLLHISKFLYDRIDNLETSLEDSRVTVASLEGDARYESGTLELSRLEGKAFDGRVGGSLRLDIGDELHFDTTLAGTGLSAAQLLEFVNVPLPLGGRVDASLEARGEPVSTATWSGTGEFVIHADPAQEQLLPGGERTRERTLVVDAARVVECIAIDGAGTAVDREREASRRRAAIDHSFTPAR